MRERGRDRMSERDKERERARERGERKQCLRRGPGESETNIEGGE